MKLIVATSGAYGLDARNELETAYSSMICMWPEPISEVLLAEDPLGEQFANDHSFPIMQFPADWKRYRLGAGMIRNKKIVNEADILLALWDGKHRNTQMIIQRMRLLRKPYFVWEIS